MPSFLEPKPGLVIRYAYLWRSEADKGYDEGVKDRPCAVVLATRREVNKTIVMVAPITHSQPGDASACIEIPTASKMRLGLDDERSWIVTSEVNVFTWPGPDVRPADPRHPERGIAFGYLPGPLAQAMIDGVLQQMRTGRSKAVQRDD